MVIAILAVAPLRRRFRSERAFVFLDKLIGISTDLGRALTNKAHSATTLSVATSTHLLRIATFMSVAAALHAEVDFPAIYALVPISLLVAMVPITVGSWGVREASMIFFLGLANVPAATALGISVTYGILILSVGLLGGIIWTFARSHHFAFLTAEASQDDSQAVSSPSALP